MNREKAKEVLQAMRHIYRCTEIAGPSDYTRRIAKERADACSFALEEIARLEGLEK